MTHTSFTTPATEISPLASRSSPSKKNKATLPWLNFSKGLTIPAPSVQEYNLCFFFLHHRISFLLCFPTLSALPTALGQAFCSPPPCALRWLTHLLFYLVPRPRCLNYTHDLLYCFILFLTHIGELNLAFFGIRTWVCFSAAVQLCISSDLSKWFFNFNSTVFAMQKTCMSIVLDQVEDYELGKLWGSISTCDLEVEYIFPTEIKQVARLKGKPQLFVIRRSGFLSTFDNCKVSSDSHRKQ